MRYDDIEAHKSLVNDNVELVELVKDTQKTDKFWKFAYLQKK